MVTLSKIGGRQSGVRKNLPPIQQFAECISIKFNDHYTKFHAPWLWQNASCNEMMPSGQRKSSPGSWDIRTSIVNATICHYSDLDCSLKNECNEVDMATSNAAVHMKLCINSAEAEESTSFDTDTSSE
eukprot:404609_1